MEKEEPVIYHDRIRAIQKAAAEAKFVKDPKEGMLLFNERLEQVKGSSVNQKFSNFKL